MDYIFPSQLYPNFYLNEPSNLEWKHDYGGWGSFGHLLDTNRGSFQSGFGRETQFRFQPQHKVDGELWIPTEPIVSPLFPPNQDTKCFQGQSASPDDFPEHMEYFYVHYCMDSFSVMGQLLAEHFSFGHRKPKDVTSMGRMKEFLCNLEYKKCKMQHSRIVNRCHHLLGDVISDIPSSLLSELLHEELIHQNNVEYFHPNRTGGALAYIPIFESQNEALLVFPSGNALNSINFYFVQLELEDDLPIMKVVNEPLVFNLDGAMRQTSVAQVDNEAYLGLRSDYFCAAWVLKHCRIPHPLEVVQLKDQATSLNVSPHVSGEFVIASESGAAYLWILDKGLQKIREEKTNLFFGTKSPWRWCEFTAHPRVMIYADRTGAELTDMRSSVCRTLFRIDQTAACKRDERVVLSKYLAQSNSFHHLISTQFSAYLLDERMPCVPVLKWEHMMESPPCFVQVVPASGQTHNSKIILGGQKAQETILLQYSGGRESACQAEGPVQKLFSPHESLRIRQLPHRQHKAKARLTTPAIGLTATQYNDFLCVLQLTEAGDIFCQMLRHFDPTNSVSKHSDNVESVINPVSSRQSQVSLDEDSNFERAQHQSALSQVVVNDSDHVGGSHTLDNDLLRIPTNESINTGSEPSIPSARTNCACPVRPVIPETPSHGLKLIWKKWLESLLAKPVERKRHMKHRKIKTSAIIQCKVKQRCSLKEDKFQRLRNDQAEIMKRRKLLVHGETCLPLLNLIPIPDEVNPEDWTDDLSQRVSASWRDRWSNWWEEKLGLNRDAKIKDLRRKYRQAKRAKARNRVALPSSFTSSISYQDSLSKWLSATSQYPCSDTESISNSQKAPVDETISESLVLHKGNQSMEQGSDVTDTNKALLKSPQEVDRSAKQDKTFVLPQSTPSDLQQLTRQATIMENDSTSRSSLKESWQNEVTLSVASAPTRSQTFGFLSPSRSLRMSSQSSLPQKKKPRMGF